MLGVLSYIKSLSDLILPRTCIVCGRELWHFECYICLYCKVDFPLTYFWYSKLNPMSEHFNLLIQSYLERDDKDCGFRPFVKAIALFYYNSESLYSSITKSLKYNGNLGLGRFFSRELGEYINETGCLDKVDYIIPVPLHWTRNFYRGYNQAEVISVELSKLLDAVVLSRFFIRVKRTRSQTLLDIEEKRENVAEAFILNKKVFNSIYNRNIHIVLVDDVYTTGSTLFSCYKALYEYLNEKNINFYKINVSLITLGFVGN